MLNSEDYFSPEMTRRYMSASQFKTFETCEARALAILNREYEEDKEVFKEGHYFEACLAGDKDLFLARNPDMVSSRGQTKGDIKSNYRRVDGSVERFAREPVFTDIYCRCEKQAVVIGEIAGVKFKGMIDLLDMETFDAYDIKCVKDFRRVWSDADGAYVKWFFAYGYHYQMAIYRELIRRTYGRAGRMALLAATKEEIPDVGGFVFAEEVLDNAMGIVKEFAPRYDALKRGEAGPSGCGHCDYCKQTKTIHEFETVVEYE